MSAENDECQTCGDPLLDEGVLYWDGQKIICPSCGTVHWISCDSESGPALRGPADY